ncbi:MAG: peptidase U32 family protein [Chitinispirillaceae bacterium]
MCAQAAFDHGADAVYAGIGKFNLRAHSPNFSVEEFGELVQYASGEKRRVYAAVNIMPDDTMLDSLSEILEQLRGAEALPHGFIVSDPGVLRVISRICPEVELHLSTQTGCFNSASMQFWKDQGVSRVVLPRELDLEQIQKFSSMNILETEVFVHGAMCVSISGRCLLGAYLGKRHPNLGDCPQPCRFNYRIVPQEVGMKTAHDGFLVEESENGAYLLNSKDLCTLKILPQIVRTGAASFKIEGRNKSAHYVAAVVKVYRDALNLAMEEPEAYRMKSWWMKELNSIEHRSYTCGFYTEEPFKQDVYSSKASAGHRLIGMVKAVVEGRPVVDVKNSFNCGQSVNILPVRQRQEPYNLQFERIVGLDGKVVEKAVSNRLVALEGCSERLRTGDMLRVSI